ncbi:glycoside hydrolase family 6 protein [Streptoalloteichus hindustanus]|uniref:Glucanase n=1 Tax=Streptoalloteichus hindustanus TaxID=2017 RepID=A0A1M5B262_STRHI|nr:glycoside hydrolase family 6 protein [Streptoalloteichus hindustanus]SHF36272.1 Glycosyl hydrolases family 6 [Streptoalloteichus hindustanus]
MRISRLVTALAVAVVTGLPTLASAHAAAGNPVRMTDGFYADPNLQAAVWVRAHSDDPRAGRISSAVAAVPQGKWFGEWSGDVRAAVSAYVRAADRENRLPILVPYFMYGRDCGSHSAGGAPSPDAYKRWISDFVAGIGDRPAVVVLEPDALAQRLDCVPSDQRATRLDLLRHAVGKLRSARNAWTYLDAGNASWVAPDTLAGELHAAGVRGIRGFALNVSNYHTTAQSKSYADKVNAALKARFGYTKALVVDSSRNGNGPAPGGAWCNPPGRRVGTPTRAGGASGVEMLLWVKNPGESDGTCGIAPDTRAGQFSPDLAVRLIDGR